MRAIQFVALALIPSLALANGGPVDYGVGSVSGVIGPQSVSTITLLREDLTIKLNSDGKSYSVLANYAIDAATTVTGQYYAVPVDITTNQFFDQSKTTLDEILPPTVEGNNQPVPNEDRVAFDALRKSISIVVKGRSSRRFSCEYDQKINRKIVPRPIENPYDPAQLNDEVLYVWCVTKIDIPAGKSVLTLGYTAKLDFADDATSKSSLTNYGARILRYDFSPAGGWANNGSQTLKVTLDGKAAPGRLYTTNPQFPLPAKAKEASWTFANVDLKSLPVFALGIDVAREMLFQDVMKVPASKIRDVRTTASASSAQTKVSRLFDGNQAAAWCADTGKGVGEVIKVNITKNRADFPHFEGFYLIPGFAKTEQLFVANNRIREIEVACGGKTATTAFDTNEAIAYSSKLIALPQDCEAGDFEITIKAIERGSKYDDTCISELVPIFNRG